MFSKQVNHKQKFHMKAFNKGFKSILRIAKKTQPSFERFPYPISCVLWYIQYGVCDSPPPLDGGGDSVFIVYCSCHCVGGMCLYVLIFRDNQFICFCVPLIGLNLILSYVIMINGVKFSHLDAEYIFSIFFIAECSSQCCTERQMSNHGC